MKTSASRKYFQQVLDKVMQAPINLYFDTTPIAKIQSRFSKDLQAVEGPIYNLMQDALTIGFKLSTTVWLLLANFP